MSEGGSADEEAESSVLESDPHGLSPFHVSPGVVDFITNEQRWALALQSKEGGK